MEYSESELRSFIGPRADYYLERFRRLHLRGPKAFPFNFAAFFFSLGWLLYRRLHRIFWIALAIIVVESVVSEWVATTFLGLETASATYNQLVTLAYAVTVGTFANAWYYRHAARRLATSKRMLPPTSRSLGPAVSDGGHHWCLWR